MTPEHRIQNEIRLALADSCILFRMNVGTGYTHDGRYFSTGVPKGFSDLFGFRKSDGRAVFIEVKTNEPTETIPLRYAESRCDYRYLQKCGRGKKTH